MNTGSKNGIGTGDVFDGWNVQKVWYKEDTACLDSIGRPGIDIQTPELPKSGHWERPVICQDIFWSRDGSSIAAIHDDYGIRQYLLGSRNCDNDGQLIPFTRMFKGCSIVTSQVHPLYSLYNDAGYYNVILTACKDLPLQMYSLQDPEKYSLNHYDIANSESGNWEIPYAINWHSEDQFLVGSVRNKVCLFDSSRRSPIWTSKSKRCHSTSKSIVSCFDERPHGEFPDNRHRIFGTYKNELYLLDHRMRHPRLLHRSPQGRGYIQILTSVNGHYLYALKRNCNHIDVLDTRQSYLPVNKLQLPFKMGNQKHKASITSSNGLTIGTDDGRIIGWSSSAVEFGAIDRNGPTHGGDYGEKSDLTINTGFGSSRINIVHQSPTEVGVCALSYSPDKMAYTPDDHASSGIHIMELPNDWFGL